MSRQQRLDPIEQLRAGQQIEHRVGIGIARALADTSLLSRDTTIDTMRGGWLLGWWLRCRNLQPTIRPSQPPRFSPLISRLGLSQCHSTQTPIAAMHIVLGSVYAHCGDTRTEEDFCRFIVDIIERNPG